MSPSGMMVRWKKGVYRETVWVEANLVTYQGIDSKQNK